ncbi:MAG: hypothetical protein R3D98_01890 [Candidatus Krumholzibacteriia bacterium]
MSFKSGCLKPALFGCLGLTVLLVVVVGVTTLMALNGVKHEQVADAELAAGQGEAVDPAQLAILASRPGRVELDLSAGEFSIKPGEPGSGVLVKARFDRTTHKLEDRLQVLPDSSWVYRVKYHSTISGMQALMRAIVGGNQESKVEVFLPPDVPIDLVVDLHQGGGEMELGGLWVRDAELNYGQGGVQLSVSEPLREPMNRLLIAGSMGGVDAKRLGNASPRYLGIDCRMGGGDIDLRGEWLNGADVGLKVRMGGISVHVPAGLSVEGAAIQGGAEGVQTGDPEVPLPILHVTIDQSMGEVELVRR